jgi:hypothetical protein
MSVPVNLLAIASALLLCIALGLRVARRRKAWLDAGVPWPFCARKPLASAEQMLYQRLVTALPGHIVLFQVPVAAVLGVRMGLDRATWNQRIHRLQYNFVVCTKDATVLAAIELEDSARSAQAPSGAEGIKERASAAAGVRLIRWQAKALPNQAEIQATFGELLRPFIEQVSASANQSWWPPLPTAKPERPSL